MVTCCHAATGSSLTPAATLHNEDDAFEFRLEWGISLVGQIVYVMSDQNAKTECVVWLSDNGVLQILGTRRLRFFSLFLLELAFGVCEGRIG